MLIEAVDGTCRELCHMFFGFLLYPQFEVEPMTYATVNTAGELESINRGSSNKINNSVRTIQCKISGNLYAVSVSVTVPQENTATS